MAYTFTEIVKFWRDYAKENEQKKIVSEYQNLIDELDLLRMQIVHGVPEKYLELVKIKQIGRVRAQILYKNGYKNKASLKGSSKSYKQVEETLDQNKLKV